MTRRLLAALVTTSALTVATSAHAQQAAPTEPMGSDVPSREYGAKPIQPDSRTGHFYIRAGGDLEVPSGFLRSGVGINDVIGLGGGIDAQLGVGLSRHAEINVAGTYAFMQSAGHCPSCTGDHAAVNLGFTYHLVEGASIDPWARLGMGYRTGDYEASQRAGTTSGAPLAFLPGRFHGVDFADISLGATFFPTPSFGLGPFLAANVGTYVVRPAPAGIDSGAARAYAFFQIGAQIEFDPVRLAEKHPAATAPKRKVGSAVAEPSY